MIDIRPASEAQIGIIRETAHRTWPSTYGGILTPYQLNYMLDRFYSDAALTGNFADGHQFLIAWEGDAALGFASSVHDRPRRGTTKIPKIYVVPEAQGKGIGKKLLDTIADKARAAGSSKLTLNVNRFNKALDFYKHIGFKIVGEEDIDLGNGVVQEDYVLEMALD